MNGNYKGEDAIGRLMRDFHQADPDNMHYKELAEGVRHYKESKGGNETMCEAVEKYAKEYSIKSSAYIIKNIMESTKCTLQGALDNAKISGEDRKLIIEEISENQI